MENIEIFTDSASGMYLVDHDKQIAIGNLQWYIIDEIKYGYINDDDNDFLLINVESEEEKDNGSLYFVNYDKFMGQVNSGEIDCPKIYRETIELYHDRGSGGGSGDRRYLVDHDRQIAIGNVQWHTVHEIHCAFKNYSDDLLDNAKSEEEYLENDNESLYFVNYDKFMDNINSGKIYHPNTYNEKIELFNDSAGGIYLVDHDKQIAIGNLEWYIIDEIKYGYINENDLQLYWVISEEEYLEVDNGSLYFLDYDKFMNEVESGKIDCPEKYKKDWWNCLV
jgi:hypothetical protein